MKTLTDNRFRTLNAKQMNDVMGGYYVVITLPNGKVVVVNVQK
ncbi:hypothetical protein SDC9_35407 [bioreactor metagenome]|jgi:hypothetical protein|uniref:Uncharacterized protein n=1 Tax=bioreactor metagenome TaxID=1076179 RepID=A0A644VFG3_9ZZZZ|nr:hypothetical protein [Paludibacter sp.]